MESKFQSPQRQPRHLCRVFTALAIPWLWVTPLGGVTLAQVPITSSGLNTQVSAPMMLPSGKTQYNITGGTRPGGGTNLYHGFGEFGVPLNNIANFLNDSGLATSNILGRVAGGNPSNIFGTIQTEGFGSANLFLMNPAGVLLGPSAQVNVGGMVNVTTADYLRLTDGVRFEAAIPTTQDALLSTSPVAAFGFLGSTPRAITIQGSQLSVPSDQAISLVGGIITVQAGTLENGTVQPARVSAPSGQVNLASVGSAGEVLNPSLQTGPNINNQSFTTMGTVTLSQGSIVDVSGNGGGSVVIRGGRFLLNESQVSANTTGPAIGPLVGEPGAGIDIQVAQDVAIENKAFLETNVSKDVAAGIGSGGVRVKADRIEILGVLVQQPPFTGIRSTVAPNSTGGRSGDIRVEAKSILVRDEGELRTRTEGFGDAGHIFLNVNEKLEVDRGTIGSGSFNAAGNAGNIEVTTQQGKISLVKRGMVTSQTINSSGNAGAITVRAGEGDIILADQGSLFTAIRGTGGTGGSGQIQLTANNLHLLNQSVISGDNLTPLLPGSITLTLSGNLSLRGGPFGGSIITTSARRAAAGADLNITGKDILITENSILSTESRITASGPGGNLNILADSLEVTNGGQMRSGASGSGNGGTLNLQIGDLFVTAGGKLTATSTSTGKAGNITVQGLASPANSVVIDGAGSGIFTNTQATGAGGNIDVFTQSVNIQNGGTLSAATSGVGDAGAITAKLGILNLTGNSSISSSSTGAATGAAGSVTIQGMASPANAVTLTNSTVATSAANTGQGGSIRVDATNLTLDNATVSASVKNVNGADPTDGPGVGLGNIDLTASTLDMTGGTITAQTTGTRNAGTVTITTTGNTLTLTDNAEIGSSSTGTTPGSGKAGSVTINAGSQFISQGSKVTVGTEQADGGDITLNATNLVQLTDSQITATVKGGEGKGGNVSIDPDFVLLENSSITANAFGGPGGNINIVAGTFLMDPASSVTASSAFSAQGTVNIQSPVQNISTSLAPLPKNFASAAALLAERCAARAQDAKFSTFVLAGRDGVPPEPGGLLPSPLIAADSSGLATPMATGGIHDHAGAASVPINSSATLGNGRFTFALADDACGK